MHWTHRQQSPVASCRSSRTGDGCRQTKAWPTTHPGPSRACRRPALRNPPEAADRPRTPDRQRPRQATRSGGGRCTTMRCGTSCRQRKLRAVPRRSHRCCTGGADELWPALNLTQRQLSLATCMGPGRSSMPVPPSSRSGRGRRRSGPTRPRRPPGDLRTWPSTASAQCARAVRVAPGRRQLSSTSIEQKRVLRALGRGRPTPCASSASMPA
jgi:hypothetical protein